VKILRVLLVVALVAAAVFGWRYSRSRVPAELVLTGIVTTEDVLVSPQVAGRIESLMVDVGDEVAAGDLVALIAPAELQADKDYFQHSLEALSAQIGASEADVLAAEAQRTEAQASLERAEQLLQRTESVAAAGGLTREAVDQARSGVDVARARVAAALGRVAASRGTLAAAERQRDAAGSRVEGADIRLSYAEVRAPIPGIVDVRVGRLGEVVGVGQPLITLVDPDDFWVRADVEESYIENIRSGDKLTVRLPSGAELEGTVFYRGVDAEYATQRDVSRTKRDIRTFEVRLRVDNRDRRLALGMTAYVILPLSDDPS
jgi:multidrug resistance efflux pump